MNITDEELLMIEHLTYLNESVAKAAGLKGIELVENRKMCIRDRYLQSCREFMIIMASC